MKKHVFVGWTAKSMVPCWCYDNTFNLTAVIQKTKNEALARYDTGNVKKIIITIEDKQDE